MTEKNQPKKFIEDITLEPKNLSQMNISHSSIVLNHNKFMRKLKHLS